MVPLGGSKEAARGPSSHREKCTCLLKAVCRSEKVSTYARTTLAWLMSRSALQRLSCQHTGHVRLVAHDLLGNSPTHLQHTSFMSVKCLSVSPE